MIPRPSRVLVTNPDRQLPCHFSKTVLRIPSKRELPVFLCQRYEPVPPATRQTPADLPHCSSRQGWPGRMPVPDVRWLHRDRGKCLWTFFCSNARSFDRPTAAKPGKKIKVPFFIRRKGADAFRPALAAGGSLMAYKCLSLCGLFFFKGFCKSLFQIGFDFSQVVSRSLHCEAENLLLFRVSEIAGIVFERFLP
jgi:hypothetical protein